VGLKAKTADSVAAGHLRCTDNGLRTELQRYIGTELSGAGLDDECDFGESA
jgi:hypothetical protein